MSTGKESKWGVMVDQIRSSAKYSELIRAHQSLKRFLEGEKDRQADGAPTWTRIAIVGNSTLSFILDPLEVYLAKNRIRAEFFVGQYDNYRQELLVADSELFAFCPQIVVILLDHYSIRAWPSIYAPLAEVRTLAETQMKEWMVLWKGIHHHCSATIIQSNVAIPTERTLGNFEGQVAWSRLSYLRRLNQLISESVPSYVRVLDVEHLSALIGKDSWFDTGVWYRTKQPVGFQAVPRLAFSLACLVGAVLGKSKKCLVLDLDDTLWGGIVGDMGVEGIRLGSGDPIGEAFVDFQKYCKALKERGILLAVCSKNDEKIARAAIEKHPEMVLRLDDFSVFVANWNDKVTNLRQLAAQLNLGLDSLVFVDDNPVERALVRRYLPEVSVLELPEDPALYCRALDREGYFEIVVLSKEDLERSALYAAEQKRAERSATIGDYDEFLKSLKMVCKYGPFDAMNLPRIVQLINKTNQWNLTNKRVTEGEGRLLMKNPNAFSIWIRNQDCFGDNGLIAILIALEEKKKLLVVDNWVMSCRVFNRGIEDLTFQILLEEARLRGVEAIEGEYRPTAKNTLVASLFQTMGFKKVGEEAGGLTRWRIQVDDGVHHRPHHIRVERLERND